MMWAQCNVVACLYMLVFLETKGVAPDDLFRESLEDMWRGVEGDEGGSGRRILYLRGEDIRMSVGRGGMICTRSEQGENVS